MGADIELCAEVFDGGWGDHPKLLPALQAYTRIFNAEYATRLRACRPHPMSWDIERQRVESLLQEHMRVCRLRGASW